MRNTHNRTHLLGTDFLSKLSKLFLLKSWVNLCSMGLQCFVIMKDKQCWWNNESVVNHTAIKKIIRRPKSLLLNTTITSKGVPLQRAPPVVRGCDIRHNASIMLDPGYNGFNIPRIFKPIWWFSFSSLILKIYTTQSLNILYDMYAVIVCKKYICRHLPSHTAIYLLKPCSMQKQSS